METKQIDAFLQQMEEDPALRQAFTEFADQHGLSLLAEELSQGDLDSVAGGIDTVPLPDRPAFRAGAVRGIIDTNTRGIIDTNTNPKGIIDTNT